MFYKSVEILYPEKGEYDYEEDFYIVCGNHGIAAVYDKAEAEFIRDAINEKMERERNKHDK